MFFDLLSVAGNGIAEVFEQRHQLRFPLRLERQHRRGGIADWRSDQVERRFHHAEPLGAVAAAQDTR